MGVSIRVPKTVPAEVLNSDDDIVPSHMVRGIALSDAYEVTLALREERDPEGATVPDTWGIWVMISKANPDEDDDDDLTPVVTIPLIPCVTMGTELTKWFSVNVSFQTLMNGRDKWGSFDSTIRRWLLATICKSCTITVIDEPYYDPHKVTVRLRVFADPDDAKNSPYEDFEADVLTSVLFTALAQY